MCWQPSGGGQWAGCCGRARRPRPCGRRQSWRGRGRDSGLRPGSGAPPRGVPIWFFPRSASQAPVATCSVVGDDTPAPFGCILAAAAHWVWEQLCGQEAKRPRGPGRPTGTCGADSRGSVSPGDEPRRQGRASAAPGGYRCTLVGGFPKKKPDSAARVSCLESCCLSLRGAIYRKKSSRLALLSLLFF